MKDVTFVVKTFERPECVRRLIESILEYYPTVPILVADDSNNPISLREFASVEVFHLPYAK